jgi:hypothetical protein
MSSTFAALQSLFRGRHPHQPADLPSDFEIELPAEEDEELVEKSTPYLHAHLAGEVFGIEYTTPKGDLSRRWITIEGFKQSNSGNWAICAYCFTRKGLRSFPLDRVQALFDGQGEPVDVSEIFPHDNGGVRVPNLKIQTTGKAVIDTCRDGLRALTALAKIDGRLVDEEVEAIVKYAKSSSTAAGVDMGLEEEKAIQRYVRNLQPTGDVVTDCVHRIGELELPKQEDFFWYAREIMDADGLQDESEVEMILEISETLAGELKTSM